MSEHPNWLEARAQLSSVLGQTCDFVIDEVPGISPELWAECKFPWEAEEEDRWAQLCETVGYRPTGPLTFVPDTSYQLGPFFTREELLPEFFAAHRAASNDWVLTSADLFVISPGDERVIIYHHSELVLVLARDSVL